MRQIKFRAWDKENKNMLYPKPLSPIKFMLSFSGEFGWFDLDKQMWSGIIPKRYYELMQYTGLKDKNGTEIYEGDIVDLAGLMTGVISFEEGCFGVEWSRKGQRMRGLKFEPFKSHGALRSLVVIGNIYEDPHLLGGEGE